MQRLTALILPAALGLLPACFQLPETLQPSDGSEGDGSEGVAPDSDGGESDDTNGDADPNPEGQGEPSFFVTSWGNGGGNLGGLEGADAFCQTLAEQADLDGTWHAYLSTGNIEGHGTEVIHARDRIGHGPWFNTIGERVANDVDELHTLGLTNIQVLDEYGEAIPDGEADIITGSDPKGWSLEYFPDNPDSPSPTCLNWTSDSPDDWTMVGHAYPEPDEPWTYAHGAPCDDAGMADLGGSGRIYCFAI